MEGVVLEHEGVLELSVAGIYIGRLRFFGRIPRLEVAGEAEAEHVDRIVCYLLGTQELLSKILQLL